MRVHDGDEDPGEKLEERGCKTTETTEDGHRYEIFLTVEIGVWTTALRILVRSEARSKNGRRGLLHLPVHGRFFPPALTFLTWTVLTIR